VIKLCMQQKQGGAGLRAVHLSVNSDLAATIQLKGNLSSDTSDACLPEGTPCLLDSSDLRHFGPKCLRHL